MTILTKLFPFLDPAHIAAGDLPRRLRTLADDAERLAIGRDPSQAVLLTSPYLEDWVPAVTPMGVQLIGHVSGHPLLGDRAIATSPLWFADPQGEWVRSLSRFYRLGPSAGPDDFRRVLTAMARTGAGNDGDENPEDES